MKRNLLFITTDQQRQDSLPCYGLPFIRTPHLDRLAAEGTTFDQCYVPAPLCVPCRAAIMSGYYPSSVGTLKNDTWLEPNVPTWPELIGQAGYRTAGIGKMHFAPWDILNGFDERIVCEDKRHSYIPDDHAQFLQKHGLERPHPADFPNYYETNGAPVYPYDKRFHPDAYIADQAAEWLDRNGDSPFAVWVSFVGPHDPYDPPAELASMYEHEAIPEPLPVPDDLEDKVAIRQQRTFSNSLHNSMFRIDPLNTTPEQFRTWRSHYYANISLIDEGVGKILETLERKGILDNTTIVFTSDHGDALGDHGTVYKGFFYESMVKVPLIVRGPDVPASLRVGELVGTLDLIPYFFETCGVEAPSDLPGRSIRGLLDRSEEERRPYVFSELDNRAMVREERYKYIFYSSGEKELYDLASDPHEMINLANRESSRDVVDRLHQALALHMMETRNVHTKFNRKVAYAKRLELEEAYRLSLQAKQA
ncbi:MAG: sulfatase-like hydrolase/transferase [Paenibacillaceae bacterium]|nr:sulfatase-like hydrolase/transferase [Paenibacillaceae bacterium]